MHLHILTTGGTFDKIYHDALSEFTIGEPMAPELLADAGINLTYSVESLLKKDSLELTDADREHLGVISDKTIVFTGAMQPARMRNSDAPFNLGFAIGALQCLDCGIYLAMNGQIFNANNVQKNRQMSRFETL